MVYKQVNMELELYSTIEYTAGWYYRNFPGFYNIECYKILADYSHNPNKYILEDGIEESKEPQEDDNDEQVHKKIRLSDNNHNGLHIEY